MRWFLRLNMRFLSRKNHLTHYLIVEQKKKRFIPWLWSWKIVIYILCMQLRFLFSSLFKIFGFIRSNKFIISFSCKKIILTISVQLRNLLFFKNKFLSWRDLLGDTWVMCLFLVNYVKVLTAPSACCNLCSNFCSTNHSHTS